MQAPTGSTTSTWNRQDFTDFSKAWNLVRDQVVESGPRIRWWATCDIREKFTASFVAMSAVLRVVRKERAQVNFTCAMDSKFHLICDS